MRALAEKWVITEYEISTHPPKIKFHGINQGKLNI